MRSLLTWLGGAGVGFVRACVLVAVTMLVPAVWAAAVALAIWWSGNPWSWIALFLLACLGTVGLSRPVCRLVRALVRRWTGAVVPAGYRQAEPVARMSTGYWWNGFSYERTRRDAVSDQRRRLRWADPAIRRDLRFVLIAPLAVGSVAAVPLVSVAVAILGLARLAFPASLIGVAGLVLAVGASPYAWRVVEPVAVRFLGSRLPGSALAERVAELTAQRADLTVAQAAEIRRIERDLHDGAQARLVALGMSLATAEKLMETDPDQARALLRDARAGAAASLTELRELVRGISPPVLNERGLVDAVRALALDSPLEVRVDADQDLRLDPPVEAALYFAVAELLTNAARHSGSDRAGVRIARDETTLVVEVGDDGRGGAGLHDDGGLAGLRRRLSVFDGTLDVTSPAGGPTRVKVTVPCGSW